MLRTPGRVLDKDSPWRQRQSLWLAVTGNKPAMRTITRRDPDARGYFGEFGGRYVPETLVEPIDQLERAYFEVRSDPASRRSSIAY